MSIGTERSRAIASAALGLALAAGCRQDMHDQPRYEPLEASSLFADGTSARSPVEGSVAWGGDPREPDSAVLREDALLFTGRSEPGSAAFAAAFPFEITAPLLDRGHERYEIFCAACHDHVGTGQGMVVQRGFRQPPTFHSDRLREVPEGYLYDVITTGFGAMPSYASQIPVRDRWLIVAYLRALQLSQHARPEDLRP